MHMNRLDKQGRPARPSNLAEGRASPPGGSITTPCATARAGILCALERSAPITNVTGSDYPVLQDWEVYRETFAVVSDRGPSAAEASRYEQGLTGDSQSCNTG